GGVNIVSQRAVLAARQGSQDCIKHTIKILRNCFSKESQHNPGSTLVSSAPNLWAVDLWKVVRVYARGCRRAAIFEPSSRLHVGVRDKRGCYGVREAQTSSNRPERMQQRRAMLALASRTDQRIADRVRRSRIT